MSLQTILKRGDEGNKNKSRFQMWSRAWLLCGSNMVRILTRKFLFLPWLTSMGWGGLLLRLPINPATVLPSKTRLGYTLQATLAVSCLCLLDRKFQTNFHGIGRAARRSSSHLWCWRASLHVPASRGKWHLLTPVTDGQLRLEVDPG